MKTTRYFEEQVLRKRPYLQRSWCSEVLEAPLRREVQSDGRMAREAREIVEGLVVDFDAKLDVVGLDIDHASKKLDLSVIETVALPQVSAAE